MDHARDIYLQEVVAKKASPVKVISWGSEQTIGSSWQVEYKGRSLTVTNHHVCSVVKRLKEREARASINAYFKKLEGILSKKIIRELKSIALKAMEARGFSIVGEYMKIGDINRKILFLSKSHDICFLEPTGGPAFKLASSYHVGERITLIGHPRGIHQTISDGRIVGEGEYEYRWLPDAGKVRSLKSTAISYPGNSGSPVINRYGNVVGILFAGSGLNYLHVNHVVPVEYVRADLETFLNE